MFHRALLTGAVVLLLQGLAPGAFAQNAQLLCFRLAPTVGQSPGLNRGTAEGEWVLCQAVLDGNSLATGDVFDSPAGDGLYSAFIVVPTFSDKSGENGLSDMAVTGTFGVGPVTPVPGGHPEDGVRVLGAFGNAQTDLNPGLPGFPIAPISGPPIFNNETHGVSIRVDMNFGAGNAQTRIDLFFAILLAPDGLKKITGTPPPNTEQPFPGTIFGPPGGVSGAAEFFPGPGPLYVGFFVGDPTGIATVPIRPDEADPAAGAEQFFASIAGIKFCDLDLDGDCSGEPLVNGTTITVDFDTRLGAQQVVLQTGVDGLSQASVEKGNGNNTIDIILLPGNPGTGAYMVTFDCSLFPGVAPNGDGQGASTTLMITETLDPAFDLQTAPADGMDDGMGVTTEPAANGTIKYTVVLDCEEDKENLDFGNVQLGPSDADPMTMGFFGALVKKAIHSPGSNAQNECGDAAPGGDILPFAGFGTPAEVAALVDAAADGCAALPTVNAAGTDVEDLLCAATGILPPGKDGSLGGTNNADAQLLAFLLNIEAGKLPPGTLVDKTCLGFANGVMSVGEIATAACLDPEAFQALLDAINNLDPIGGETMCLLEATCPFTALIPGTALPVIPGPTCAP